MRFHHTKNKGDLGVLHAMTDLAEKGFRVLLPLSEHEPFDLVAYDGTSFLRVQVKYRAAVNGLIHVPFTSSWADRSGTHTVRMNKGDVDVLCVYCPDTRCCYYVCPREFPNVKGLTLRLVPTRNKQSKRVFLAGAFTDVPLLARMGRQ